MSKHLNSLRECVGQRVLVRVSRKRIDENYLEGYVVAMSERLLLLQEVEGDTLTLNGYIGVRLKDITRWWVHASFMDRAMRLLGRNPFLPDGIDVDDWPAFITSGLTLFPLALIECEKVKPGCAYIGTVERLTARTLFLREIGTDAEDAGVNEYKLKDITSVKFGDGYVEALAVLVAHEAGGKQT